MGAASVEDIPCIFFNSLHRAERAIAGRTSLGIAAGKTPWPDMDPDKALPWAERKTGLTLAPGQADAVRVAISSKDSAINRGPGVGNRTIRHTALAGRCRSIRWQTKTNKTDMADRQVARTGISKVAAREAVDSVFAMIG